MVDEMAKLNRGRFSADVGADGKVLFLIGMRFNQLWKFWKWIPVFNAMPRMLIVARPCWQTAYISLGAHNFGAAVLGII
jgi:hypothetical protein